MPYQYIFPFNEVEKNSNIILYGGGEVGRQFLSQLQLLDYCNCLFFVDKKNKELKKIHNVNVCAPDLITSFEFDKVIISTIYCRDEIQEILRNLGIPAEKIVNKPILISNYAGKRKFSTPDPADSNAWDSYYEYAEGVAEFQYNQYFIPILTKYNEISLDNVLDFACGRGRIANLFSTISREITCCDVNTAAIEYCKKRFLYKNTCHFNYMVCKTLKNTLLQLPFPDDSSSFVYSWDAMVHFSYKWLDFYIKEFFRILNNNSYIVIHHSNYSDENVNNNEKSENLSENWFDNISGRALVSHADVKFIAENHGFTVLEQKLIDWEDVLNLDCISILYKNIEYI